MATSVKSAMVLAAGLGTRLSPITQKLPKPLVSVLNIPNILHILGLLKKSGITHVVMNLHHLSHEMEDFFKQQKYFDLNYTFTHEDPILGTGGGLKNAERFFTESPFILSNCDFVTNINLSRFIEKHVQTNSKASMVLVQDESRQHLYSKVGINAQDELVSLPKLQTAAASKHGIFTGIHILNKEVFQFLENKPSGINDVLYPALMNKFPKSVHGFIDTDGFWYDTGDLPAFLATTQALLKEIELKNPFIHDIFSMLDLKLKEVVSGVWATGVLGAENIQFSTPCLIGKGVQFGKNVEIGAYSVIGDGSVIGDSVSIHNSVLLPNSKVAAGSTLKNVIQYETISLSTKSIA